MDENTNDVFEELDLRTQRLLLGNEKLIYISNKIENAKTEEERQAWVALFGQVFKEVAADQKNADDAELRSESLELETSKAEEESRANQMREILDWAGKGILVATTIFTGAVQLHMFKRSTKKETDEAYLTTTDKVTVQESLKGSFWNKFRRN